MKLSARFWAWFGILSIVVIGFSTGGARAGWLPETRLTVAEDASYLPDNNGRCLVTDPAGDVHLVWYDYREGEAEIYYRRFNGTTWNAEQTVTSSDYSSEHPAIAADGAGNLHLVWSRYLGTSARIYHRRFDGISWGPMGAISDPATDAETPSVVACGVDQVHVVWREYRYGSWGIYYRMFDGSVWSDIELLTEPSSYPRYASITVDETQRLHVVWADYRNANWEIYYKLHDGVSWGPDERLTVDSGLSDMPTQVIDTYGNIHVFWHDDRDGDYGIYHKMNDGGGWSSDEYVVDSVTKALRPAVAAGESGRLCLTWYRDDGSNEEIYYKEFDGVAWTAEERLSVGSGASLNPAVALDGDGRTHVVWHDERDGNFEIYWRHDRDLPQPEITHIEPDSGVAYYDVHITDLGGTGFFYGMEVWMEKAGEAHIVAANVTIESPTRLTCDFSLVGAAAGYWDVVIRDILGQGDTLQAGFNVIPLPKPEILSIEPDSEFAYQYVEITNLVGAEFFPGAEVRLRKIGEADIAAANVVVQSPSRITCEFNLAAEGYWDVVVTNVDGKGDTLPSGFYVIPLPKPEITSITPYGQHAYESVHVTDLAGSGFFPGAEVWLEKPGQDDVLALNLTIESSTRITCYFSLAGADSGYWDVVVESPDGKADTLSSGFEVLPSLWGEDVRLTTLGGSSNTSKPNARCVAADNLGRVHVVWYDNWPGNDEIYYKQYDGTAWGPNERLTYAAEESQHPAIAVDSNNRVHVVWSDFRDGAYWQIYYKRHDGGGWSADTKLTDVAADCQFPSIAIGPGDEVYVAYEDHYMTNPKVYIIWHDGTAWQPEVKVSEAFGGHQRPAVAVDGVGHVHVAWSHDNQAIYYRKFDGTIWEAIVDLGGGLGSAGASIAADNSNKVHVAWHDYRPKSAAALEFEVYYRRFNGLVWDPTERITDGLTDSHNASVAADDGGNVYLVWAGACDGNKEIHYKKFDGTDWGVNIRLTDATDESSLPSLAVTPEGEAHLVWRDLRDGNYEIYYKKRSAGTLAGIHTDGLEPVTARLLKIAPNPTRAATKIRFHLSAGAETEVTIYDIAGRLVTKIDLGKLPPGAHHVSWDVTDQSGHRAAPGVYFVRVRSGARSESKKIVVLR